MFANVNDFRENNFFPVFDCILENSLKNILQCLEQRKMKKKKKKKKKKKIQKPTAKCKPTTVIHYKSTANHHKKTHKLTITANPPSQETHKPTITARPSSSPTAPPSITSSSTSSTASSGPNLKRRRSQRRDTVR
jgi:hypothetical protein